MSLERKAQRQGADLAAAQAANAVLRGGDEALALQRSIADLQKLLYQRNAELETLQAALQRAQAEPPPRPETQAPPPPLPAASRARGQPPDDDEPEVSLRLPAAAGPRRWAVGLDGDALSGASAEPAHALYDPTRDAAVAAAPAESELNAVMSPGPPSRRRPVRHHSLREAGGATAGTATLPAPLPSSSSHGRDGFPPALTASAAERPWQEGGPGAHSFASAAARPTSPARPVSPRHYSGYGAAALSSASPHLSVPAAARSASSWPHPAAAPSPSRAALLVRPTPASLQWVRAGTRPPLLPQPSPFTADAGDGRLEPRHQWSTQSQQPREALASASHAGSAVGGQSPRAARGSGFAPSASSTAWGPPGARGGGPPPPSPQEQQLQQQPAAPPVALAAALTRLVVGAGVSQGPQQQPLWHPVSSSAAPGRAPGPYRPPPSTEPGTPLHAPSPSSRPAKPQPPGQPQSLRGQYPGSSAAAPRASSPRPLQAAAAASQQQQRQWPEQLPPALPPPHAFSTPGSPPTALPLRPEQSGASSASHGQGPPPAPGDADGDVAAAAAERVRAGLRQLSSELQQLTGRPGGFVAGAAFPSSSFGAVQAPAAAPPLPRSPAGSRPPAAAASRRVTWQDTLRHLDAACAAQLF